MTTAQELGITEFPYVERNEQGKLIYYEDAERYWCMWEYDEDGKLSYWENSDGDYHKVEYDEQGNVIVCADEDDCEDEGYYLIVE